MAATTKIEWCDFTFNPWRGCQKVAPGCKHCYAEARSNRFGEDFAGQRIRLSDAGWREPLKWNRAAEQAGERRHVFCASLADVFEDWDGPIVNHKGNVLAHCGDGVFQPREIPEFSSWDLATMDDLRRDLFALIDKTPWLDWLILTKRPENIRRMWPAYQNDGNGTRDFTPNVRDVAYGGLHIDNVALLTSCSEQKSADRNIPLLLECRDLVPVLGVSAEPLLGLIIFGNLSLLKRTGPGIDWVIVGGESGAQARPCNVSWIRSIVGQCHGADVPCFVKQIGAWPYDPDWHGDGTPEGSRMTPSHPKGGDPREWPNNIRVRQFPTPVLE